MSIALPSLSEDSWIFEPTKIGDNLFAHFFLSDYRQTYIFSGEISSFSQIYYLAINDPSGMRGLLQTALEKLFSKYFEEVLVVVTIKESSDLSNSIALLLAMTFKDKQGVQYDLYRIVAAENGLSKKIIKYNNYGAAEADFNNASTFF